jgi:hypothetical protein
MIQYLTYAALARYLYKEPASYSTYHKYILLPCYILSSDETYLKFSDIFYFVVTIPINV